MTDFWDFLRHYMASSLNRKLKAFQYLEPKKFEDAFIHYKLGRN